ncbi:MAG: helix-turn-helix transcriptional regulator [Meiothermus ruber]|jgi:predicted DNA-binding transcriptional regulator YafY|uniref:YafY family transcriptional regulator n=1 Tax=Meiothermus ruber TaxID=277 RepID=A0A7C3HI06_MEIRU|nr:YafY family transcriptional regulator [Meiothermus ruber]
MRADRLVSILLLLQTRGRATTAELAKRLEVSPRTIHRDMEALTASGVPVYAERGSKGGWRLLEEYRTNLTGLSQPEIMALFALKPTQLLRDLGLGKAGENALIKMLAALPAAQRRGAEYARQRILVDIQRYQEQVPWLSVLQEAIWQDRKLRLVYEPMEGQPAERTVDPLGLVVKGSVWYLVASRQGELRSYRVSRILEASVLDEPSHRPADFDLEAYWHKARADFRAKIPSYRVQVRIQEKVLARSNPASHWGQLEHCKPAGDSWLKAQIRFEYPEQALGWVLAAGAGVEALEPLEFRKQVLEALSKALALYQTQARPVS